MAESTVILSPKTLVGVTSAGEHRRRQNRLNQRARRLRQQALKETPNLRSEGNLPKEKSPVNLADFQRLDGLRILGLYAESSTRLVSCLEAKARVEYAMGTPRTDLLLGLVQLNILRALIANIDVLGLSAAEMHDDALSPFSTAGTWHSSHDTTQLPASLVPTSLQRTIPHHPWLDLIPCPAMRNNLIRVADSLDDTELCHDLCSYQSAADGLSGVIVWRDPWDPKGWEVTRNFLHRWGWVLKDCWDLFQSTNYWRKRRGEPQLSRTAWYLASEGIQLQ